jgi:hypothetical protein
VNFKHDRRTAVRPCPGIVCWYEITHDPLTDNPLDTNDGDGDIHDTRDCRIINRPRVGNLRYEYGRDFVLLKYTEHGNCQWSVTRLKNHTADFRKYRSGFDGFWTPDDSLKELLGDLKGVERRARLEQYAAEACELYTKWCNGECFQWDLSVYQEYPEDAEKPLRQLAESDYGKHERLEEHRGSGFIGSDDAEEALFEELAEVEHIYGKAKA